MTDYTHIHLDEIEDAAPGNGFGERWEARVAIRVAPEVARAFEAGPDGLEFVAVGTHHERDGEPVQDPWTA